MFVVTWLIRAAAVFFVAALLFAPASTQTPAPEDDLPDGDGKRILLAQCRTCHELSEVTKFRGYYSRAQWRDIVITMVEYGADVNKADVEVLADYLVQHLGKQ
jgi:hypothetical protein